MSDRPPGDYEYKVTAYPEFNSPGSIDLTFILSLVNPCTGSALQLTSTRPWGNDSSIKYAIHKPNIDWSYNVSNLAYNPISTAIDCGNFQVQFF